VLRLAPDEVLGRVGQPRRQPPADDDARDRVVTRRVRLVSVFRGSRSSSSCARSLS